MNTCGNNQSLAIQKRGIFRPCKPPNLGALRYEVSVIDAQQMSTDGSNLFLAKPIVKCPEKRVRSGYFCGHLIPLKPELTILQLRFEKNARASRECLIYWIFRFRLKAVLPFFTAIQMEKIDDTIELLRGQVNFERSGPSVRICSDLQSTSRTTLELNAKIMK